jgi:hypothetical protein
MIFLFLASCSLQEIYGQVKKGDVVRYTTFRDSANGWGYSIYINDVMVIRQPNIPAISNQQGFSEEKYAVRTAKLVVKKMKKGIWPPAVTIKELKRLRIPEARK